jgi:hypothetical protein
LAGRAGRSGLSEHGEDVEMAFKILAGIFAILLMVLYIGAIAMKLKDPALFVVGAIGLAMVIVDLLQSLKEKD